MLLRLTDEMLDAVVAADAAGLPYGYEPYNPAEPVDPAEPAGFTGAAEKKPLSEAELNELEVLVKKNRTPGRRPAGSN